MEIDNKMKERIRRQLRYDRIELHCSHNPTKVCDSCKKNVSGQISSELRGQISSGLIGDITGLTGRVEDIIKILKE